ncbi:MAG: glycoside hydrolase family 3 protein [Propionibacteriales bacterium]|nr:glycoside hydrolase family 3 protein [Propionibacteriales bacterium]
MSRSLAASTLLLAYDGLTAPAWVLRRIEAGAGGVVLFGHNVHDAEQVAALTTALREARADLVLAIDEEGGDVTRLEHRTGSSSPGNAALGAADSVELTRDVYGSIGAELHTLGLTMDFAPSVDVNTAIDNPVIGTRAFGADQALVARHGAAAVDGLQRAGVAACVKHFPGHGSTTQDSHLVLPVVDEPVERLRQRELVPFAAAIDAGVAAVMSAHIRVPSLTGHDPATHSQAVLTDLLRGDLGFTGVVVTDALDMYGVSGLVGVPEAAVRALAAGADLLCLGAELREPEYDAVLDAVDAALREGRLDAGAVERSRARSADLVRRFPAAEPRVLTAAEEAAADEVGLQAAREAVQVEGPLRAMSAPYVVHLDNPPTIASGPVPWGLDGLPGADAVVVADGSVQVDAVVAAAVGRDLVLVLRDAHRHPWVRDVVRAVARARPDAVVVEMGLPVWSPAPLTRISCYGAARVCSVAVGERLLGRLRAAAR